MLIVVPGNKTDRSFANELEIVGVHAAAGVSHAMSADTAPVYGVFVVMFVADWKVGGVVLTSYCSRISSPVVGSQRRTNSESDGSQILTEKTVPAAWTTVWCVPMKPATESGNPSQVSPANVNGTVPGQGHAGSGGAVGAATATHSTFTI